MGIIEILILLYICLLLLDILSLLDLRKLLYSFLLSKRNLKGARKIHKEQTVKNKILLSYIKQYAIYTKEFIFFKRLYIVWLFSLVPQYVILLIVNMFSQLATMILLCVCFVIKLIIVFVVIRSQFNSKRISRFDHRYKK